MNFVVYSKQTGRVRRIIVDATERSVAVSDGEAAMEVSVEQYGNLHVLQALVTKETGLAPVDDQYAVIRGGKVVATLAMDPACGDRVPEGLRVIRVAQGMRPERAEYDAQTDSLIERMVEPNTEAERAVLEARR